MIANKGIEFDISRWPVLIVRPLRQVTNEEIDAFLGEYQRFLTYHKDDHATVLDLRSYKDMPPAQRKRISEGMKGDGESDHHDRCKGFALVFQSALMRMLLTGILWAAKPDYELRVFNDINEALVWARM